MKRSSFFSLSTAGLVSVLLPKISFKQNIQQEKRWQNGDSPWPICLDTYTILPASLEEKVEIAAETGYDAIEPWDRELIDYEEKGGNVTELGQRIKDLGLFVPSVIGLWNAIPQDEIEFQKSLEGTRNRMRLAQEIGSEHIQVIPNTIGDPYKVKTAANHYRELIEIGINEFGLKPALVFVTHFPVKSLGQAMAIALDANHPEAKIIPDTFHMFKSEGGFEGLKKIHGSSIAIFQFADVPANMAPEVVEDRDRVFPGDGILPLPSILKDLYQTGYRGCISLELYNQEYHRRDLLGVAKEGLTKTVNVIKEAGV